MIFLQLYLTYTLSVKGRHRCTRIPAYIYIVTTNFDGVALQLQEALNQNRRLYGTTIRSTSELFKSIDRTNDGIIIKDEIYIALIQCLNLNITKQQIDQLFHLIKDHSLDEIVVVILPKVVACVVTLNFGCLAHW